MDLGLGKDNSTNLCDPGYHPHRNELVTCILLVRIVRMAVKQHIIDSYFQEIFDNIDTKLIVPFMRTVGILTTENETEIGRKTTRKQQVKFIIDKIKRHPTGDHLFEDCLEKTKHVPGHQKLLQLLYDKVSCAGMG